MNKLSHLRCWNSANKVSCEDTPYSIILGQRLAAFSNWTARTRWTCLTLLYQSSKWPIMEDLHVLLKVFFCSDWGQQSGSERTNSIEIFFLKGKCINMKTNPPWAMRLLINRICSCWSHLFVFLTAILTNCVTPECAVESTLSLMLYTKIPPIRLR